MIPVQAASLEDTASWLKLAAEVEPLFGPMVNEPSFQEALRQAIMGGQALCIRDPDGMPGSLLCGGVVFVPEANEIAWLAVAAKHQGRGFGRALLAQALDRLDVTRPVFVTTFAETVHAGLPARGLYRRFGFRDLQSGGLNPAGIPTRVMKREPGGVGSRP